MQMKAELKGVKEALEMFDAKKVRQATRSTLDKTGTFMKRRIVEMVTNIYEIMAKDVRDKITILRTSMSSLETVLKIKSQKLSLVYFKARQAPKGLLANIKRGQVSYWPHAFLHTPDRPIWTAIRRGKPRTPLRGLKGPSVSDIVGQEKWKEPIENEAGEYMERLLTEEIEKRINK